MLTFSFFFIFAIILLSVAVVLWAGTLGLQGLLYSEPAPNLHWRAPVAGAVVAAFVALWCYLSFSMLISDRASDPSQTQLPLDTLFRFQSTRTGEEVDKLWSVRNGMEILFTRRGAGLYQDEGGRAWQRSSPEGIVKAILIDEENNLNVDKTKTKPGFKLTDLAFASLRAEGVPEAVLSKLNAFKDKEYDREQFLTELATSFDKDVDKNLLERFRERIVNHAKKKIHFETKLTKEGTFPAEGELSWLNPARLVGGRNRQAESFPGYHEVGGRQSMETLGRVSLSFRGRWFLNMLFNLAHLGVWFVGLWLLLQYQWQHALGLAVAVCVVMMLVPLPMLFDRVKEAAVPRPVPSERTEMHWPPSEPFPLPVGQVGPG